ncbi:MAG: hypothetical protein R2681_05900 [Pyrinomonadaceae bacterium]
MNEKLSSLFNKIKSGGTLLTNSEAQTSQAIVLPILHNLGWDIFETNEVTPEFSVGGKRVDYALRIKSLAKAFLEIKKPTEDLEKHQEQLVYYAFQQGVRLAILTNGITWWFYLPLEEGSWEQRKFFTIDLMEQKVGDAIEKFEDLLDKTNIENGNGYQNAKFLYDGRQKNKIIRESLPKAWEKLISEPDEMLVELLNETLERISGFKAESPIIIQFLKQLFPKPSGTVIPKSGQKEKWQNLNKQKRINTHSKQPSNALLMNPDDLDDLLHTRILSANFAGVTSSNSWRSVLASALKIAFQKSIDINDLREKVNLNIREGHHAKHGFHPIEGSNYSFQNQDANKSAKNLIALAKLLESEIFVSFLWREKGKFPNMEGIIIWKPK